MGGYVDAQLSFEHFANKIFQAVMAKLLNLRKFSRMLDEKLRLRIVKAIVFPSFDALNSLLIGTTQKTVNRVQRTLNATIRFVTDARKHDHITDHAKRLHILPIKQRIKYKVCLLVHKTIYGQMPEYIKELVQLEGPSNLRSGNDLPRVIPMRSGSNKTDMRFKFAAAKIFNELPLSIRRTESLLSFRQHLKTYMFRDAWPDSEISNPKQQ